MKLLIKNGRVIDPATGFDQVGDLAIAAGRIVSMNGALTDFSPNKTIELILRLTKDISGGKQSASFSSPLFICCILSKFSLVNPKVLMRELSSGIDIDVFTNDAIHYLGMSFNLGSGSDY